ncbi:hypothetical protein HDV05_006902 [Chytridiales sp. JEL 0842]|nr:hypothetical protein HDV05_006902 [Chytridiales sp. JEL 0842]
MTSVMRLLVAVMACMMLVAGVTAQLSSDLMAKWDNLRRLALNIEDELCSNDVVVTLDEANILLRQSGVTQRFMTKLGFVQEVAGTIPDTFEFKFQLNETFMEIAAATKYEGRTLDGKILGNYVMKGITKPVFHGHPAPASAAIETMQQLAFGASVVVGLVSSLAIL